MMTQAWRRWLFRLLLLAVAVVLIFVLFNRLADDREDTDDAGVVVSVPVAISAIGTTPTPQPPPEIEVSGGATTSNATPTLESAIPKPTQTTREFMLMQLPEVGPVPDTTTTTTFLPIGDPGATTTTTDTSVQSTTTSRLATTTSTTRPLSTTTTTAITLPPIPPTTAPHTAPPEHIFLIDPCNPHVALEEIRSFSSATDRTVSDTLNSECTRQEIETILDRVHALCLIRSFKNTFDGCHPDTRTRSCIDFNGNALCDEDEDDPYKAPGWDEIGLDMCDGLLDSMCELLRDMESPGVEQLIPESGSEVNLWHSVGLDLVDDGQTIESWLGQDLGVVGGNGLAIASLRINGVDIPSGEWRFNLGPNRLGYRIGAGQTVERLSYGRNCVAVDYYITMDAPASAWTVSWCFNAG